MSGYAQEILDIVCNTESHLSAEQIFMEMKKSNPRIAQATVYNNLKSLTASGKIIRISMPGSADRYDRNTRHDHLICDVCGSLSDISIDDFTQVIERRLGRHIRSYDLRIHYICPDCKRKQ